MSAKVKKAPARAGKSASLISAAAAMVVGSAGASPHLDATVEALADPDSVIVEALPQRGPRSKLRTYQLPVFMDQHTKVLLVECSRQIGKSHTMGQWAGKRLLLKLQEFDQWLIVLISNSKANGVELGRKVADALRTAVEASQDLKAAEIDLETPVMVDTVRDPELGHVEGVPDLELSDFSQRIEIRIGNKRGRVLVLSASPRTARGFAADLGLDEFAFHENAAAIWDAAYPMLDSNPQFVCRICSTHNGIGSQFNTWIRAGVFPVYSIKRSEAWAMGRGDKDAMEKFYAKWRAMGVRNAAQADAWFAKHGLKAQPHDRLKIMSLRTRDEKGDPRELTPAEAEAEATDKNSYRQNYENDPADAGGALLTWDLITAAETRGDHLRGTVIDKQSWSTGTLQRLYRMKADGWEFYPGQDVARTTDLSVCNVTAMKGTVRRQAARLEMRDVKLPDQRRNMEALLEVIGAKTGRVVIDSTGLGLGLGEELADKFGSLVLMVNFSETVELDAALQAEGRRTKTMGIPERMALDLLATFEDGHIELIPDGEQRDDLRKPSRIYKNGRVQIAAARTPEDHADRFWALALSEHGIRSGTFGAWDEKTIAGAVAGPCHVGTMPAFRISEMGSAGASPHQFSLP